MYLLFCQEVQSRNGGRVMRKRVRLYLKNGQVIKFKATKATISHENTKVTGYTFEGVREIDLCVINVEEIAAVTMER